MLRLFEGDPFAALDLFHPSTDRSYGLSTVQLVKQCLIALGILNDDFTAALDR
jgi:hypothetical protein